MVADNTGKWNTEMVIGEFERQMAILAEMSNIMAANKGFVSVHYTALTIDRYNMIALCRSSVDVKFLIKILNVWIKSDWRGVMETAIDLVFMALKENISTGIMVALRVSLLQEAPESIAFAEQGEETETSTAAAEDVESAEAKKRKCPSSSFGSKCPSKKAARLAEEAKWQQEEAAAAAAQAKTEDR
ncbi:hypothetical protein O3P69_018726 [Scylla paramamosain]|uniref:Uncharacterized protein n=1 Tax=Scylla paramamosain TaxID=85552 RepID=A0AAW0SSK7_SCYPA